MFDAIIRASLLATLTVAQSAVLPRPSPSPGMSVGSPSASATNSPKSELKEIGRIRVTSALCKALVADAVHAVDIETQNDVRLLDAESTLQTIDLDGNQILKHRGVREITKRFVTLRAAAVEGNALMRDFRDRAKTATSDQQRADLLTFAEALDGALHRQKILADDLGRFVAYLDAHDPIDKDTHDRQIFNALLLENDARFPRTPFDVRDFGPTAGVPDPLSVTAKYASAELIKRSAPIAGDEDAAAQKIEPAFASC